MSKQFNSDGNYNQVIHYVPNFKEDFLSSQLHFTSSKASRSILHEHITRFDIKLFCLSKEYDQLVEKNDNMK